MDKPYDKELSEELSKLWDLDNNRCNPDVDYKIDLQGYVTSTDWNLKDRAAKELFISFDEKRILSKPTYQAFFKLLDNYESDLNVAEKVTREEEKENQKFLDLIMETDVMKEAHNFLVSKNLAPREKQEFKRKLYEIWFTMYKRLHEDTQINSCGFEHVFVGEKRKNEVCGFHNWIQFYLQEKKGFIDYRGYFRRGTTEEFEKSPRLMTLQFIWQGCNGKPIGSSFIGTSPEFEVAMYTLVFLVRKQPTRVKIKEYDVEICVHSHGRSGIGTAFPRSMSD